MNSYDEIMEQKIKMLQVFEQVDSSLRTVPSMPKSHRAGNVFEIHIKLFSKKHSTTIDSPREFIQQKVTTPQFSERKRQTSEHQYASLSKKMLQISKNIELSMTHQNYVPILDAILNLIDQSVPVVDMDALRDFFQELQLQEYATHFWTLILILQYGHPNWQERDVLELEALLSILQLILESVDLNTGDQKLAKFIKDKIKQVPNYFKSPTALNRYLFEAKLHSYDKLVSLIRRNAGENQEYFEPTQAHLPNIEISRISPEPQQQPQSLNQSSGLKRSHMLYEHAKLHTEKLNNMGKVKAQQELNQCTFTPQLNHRKNNSELVYDRLFQQSRKQIVKPKPRESTSPLEQCTFKPQINPYIPTEPQQGFIPGSENLIKRHQQAREQKEYKEQYFNLQLEKLKKYNTKPIPPTNNKQQKQNVREEPVIYVDVKVSKHKSGRIGVRKRDNPDELIASFSKTFQLSEEAKAKLKIQLQQILITYQY